MSNKTLSSEAFDDRPVLVNRSDGLSDLSWSHLQNLHVVLVEELEGGLEDYFRLSISVNRTNSRLRYL